LGLQAYINIRPSKSTMHDKWGCGFQTEND
jgi:hypothetical protein